MRRVACIGLGGIALAVLEAAWLASVFRRRARPRVRPTRV